MNYLQGQIGHYGNILVVLLPVSSYQHFSYPRLKKQISLNKSKLYLSCSYLQEQETMHEDQNPKQKQQSLTLEISKYIFIDDIKIFITPTFYCLVRIDPRSHLNIRYVKVHKIFIF